MKKTVRKLANQAANQKRRHIKRSPAAFEAAFQQRIGLTPTQWVKTKIENGSRKDDVKYLFEICAEEIANENNCKAQRFERYYDPGMVKKEGKSVRPNAPKVYNKLVRDLVPEIIEKSGKRCVCETLSQEQYIVMLDAKLNEELAEYQQSKSLEELADLLEVMGAVVHARGYTWSQLTETRKKKLSERGGFEKRILLKEVYEDNTK